MTPADYEALRPFATARQAEHLDAMQEHGTQKKAAAALGLSTRSIELSMQRLVRVAALKGHSPNHDMTHVVPDGFKVKGVSTYYDDEGKVRAQWVKSSADAERQAEIVREFVAAIAEDIKGVSAPVPAPEETDSDRMCVYIIGDAHIGMRAHGKETLSEDFDSEIAKRDIQHAIDNLISTAPPTKRALLVDVGDFTHADSRKAMTPNSGNLLDVDSRHRKVTRIAAFTLRYCIEAMRKKHEMVDVEIAEGNHNSDTAGHVALALSMYYEREPRVRVVDEPSKFHYFRFHKCLIGVTHGDTVKHAELPSLMAAQRAKDWGETEHRHWIVGHIHHKQQTEYRGCFVESFNTLAPPDAWHAAHGYMAKREMNLMVFHKEYGLLSRAICPIGLIRRQQSHEQLDV